MTDSSAFKVDLGNCEREPIHVLGNIQPFGFLITVGADWRVTRASANLDDFIGIPPGEEEQVFSLCERCSNAKDFAAGTGTGLYHDRTTVMHHNGEMWCESPGLNQGSVFYVRLPIHRDGVDPKPA